MFQLVYIVASPIVAMNLKKMGRKNSVVIGYSLMVKLTFSHLFRPLLLLASELYSISPLTSLHILTLRTPTETASTPTCSSDSPWSSEASRDSPTLSSELPSTL
jgi:hypothetical protein